MKIYHLVVPAIVPFTIISIMATAVPGVRAQAVESGITVPYRSITPQVEAVIDRTAVSALLKIARARSDIHHKSMTRARHDLTEAMILMDTITNNLSTATARNLMLIARKHLEYETSENVLRDLTPIYASLDRISVYLPTDKAKEHVDRARNYLENHDKPGAERELTRAGKSLLIVEVELPLLKARQYVTKAQEYLAARNTGKADEALKAAEQRATAVYSGINAPLPLVNLNLWLAFRNYSTAGGPYLEQARSYLEQASASGSAKGKEEAGKLSQDIAMLEKKLANKEKVADSEFKAVLEKSQALAERSAAYLAAGLSEAEITLKGENNLIEAKLHVDYAEIYQVTTGEPEKALLELDTASSYLQKAARSSLAGSADSRIILGIDRLILALKLHPEKSDAGVQERYDTIKDELNDLIQKL